VLERWSQDPEAVNPGSIFDAEYLSLSEKLARDPDRQHFADLVQTFGLTEWSRLRAWAIRRCEAVPQRSSKAADSKPEAEKAAGLTLGAEVLLISRTLRLRGRADRISRVGRNAFEIRDYKTGSVLDEAGRVKEEVALQLRAYGLMILEHHPTASVRLIVDDGLDHEVEFDEAARIAALKAIEDIVARMPAAGILQIDRTARPGAGCFGCRVRHICPPYRAAAPRWWAEYPAEINRIPNDTWGSVVEIVHTSNTVQVMLMDEAGRRVRIDGLERRHGLTDGLIPERVLFFELEASGPARDFNGRKFHPRSFHEIARDRRERRAWNTQSFVEAEARQVS
jgi:RecB family exonuclease